MKKSTFGERVMDFYMGLSFSHKLEKGIEAMNPYGNKEVQNYTKQFLEKFFSDDMERIGVFGINPGRFGSGLTGVNFTDPVALEQLGIKNNLLKKREVSSEFIYMFIEKWGGPKKFCKQFFLSALSPLGFTKNGINYNFYDDKTLLAITKPFIIETLNAQIALGLRRDNVVIIGAGKNLTFFNDLNNEHRFFKKVLAVEHPRFIMQYNRKKLSAYLEKYTAVFKEALTK